ncbi:MAG: hypothetical protein VX738_03905 [Planctomycetota bacterium]|nr:hypothetical protein [Planctomycetota bacterium]
MKWQSTLVIGLLLSATAIHGEIKSGLQVGDFADAFDVKDCSSAQARGKSLCYR